MTGYTLIALLPGQVLEDATRVMVSADAIPRRGENIVLDGRVYSVTQVTHTPTAQLHTPGVRFVSSMSGITVTARA